MKIKKLLINLLAVVMMCASALCFTACEELVTVEVKFEAYDYENSRMFEDEEVTLTVQLYRHLAKETVDSIVEHVNNGLYNNAVVYKFTDKNKTQFMMGDLRYDEQGNIVYVPAPEIKGEFASNGVVGSNLKVTKGSVGIWRTGYACETGLVVSSQSRNTGRATWFIPTEANSIYDGYVCVFGQIDLESDASENVYGAVEQIFAEEERFINYEIYFTGEYDQTKPNENYGLSFNIIEESQFDEDEIEDLFVADANKQELTMYNHYTISVPVKLGNGNYALKVASVTVK